MRIRKLLQNLEKVHMYLEKSTNSFDIEKRFPDYFMNDYFFLQILNNVLALFLCKINVLGLFHK